MRVDGGEVQDASTAPPIERTITENVYCAQCGYNLRTLFWIGRCPECNSEYNSRPLHMKGIYTEQAAAFPWGVVLCLILCWGFVLVLFPYGFRPTDEWRLFFVVAFAVMGFLYARLARQQLARYAVLHRIAKRIEQEEDYD